VIDDHLQVLELVEELRRIGSDRRQGLFGGA
jgi:hypothetical protein